jgi:hypothetical protein
VEKFNEFINAVEKNDPNTLAKEDSLASIGRADYSFWNVEGVAAMPAHKVVTGKRVYSF